MRWMQTRGLRRQPRFRDSDGAPLGDRSDSCSSLRREHCIGTLNDKKQAIREMSFASSLVPQEFVQLILRTGFDPVSEIQREPAEREMDGAKCGVWSGNLVLKIRQALHRAEQLA